MALFESLGTVSYSSYIPFGKEKLEWSGYPMVKKRLRICVSVLTEYRRVTDRRTNGQTDSLDSVYVCWLVWQDRYTFLKRAHKCCSMQCINVLT